jgi:dienelactone hydrolase
VVDFSYLSVALPRCYRRFILSTDTLEDLFFGGRLILKNRSLQRLVEKVGLGAVAEARFDIGLLASRLAEVTRWLVAQPEARDLGIGYFGSSTGGGAALVAAVEIGQRIDAVVSRGGRPDLAGDALPRVQSPALLIVGGYDEAVIRLNKESLAKLRCEKELKIVPCATHLFEEPGALEAVARPESN